MFKPAHYFFPPSLVINRELHTRWLLEHGADPNMSPTEWSEVDLLTIAAATSPLAVIKLLLEHGVNLEETQALHAVATTIAIEMDHHVYDTVACLIEIMRILLDSGADVNAMERDPIGRKNKRPRSPIRGYTFAPCRQRWHCGSCQVPDGEGC